MNILRRYDSWLIKAPLTTKWASSFVIFGLCEFNAQIITCDFEGSEGAATFNDRFNRVDWRQVLGYASLSFYNAPAMHAFYNFAVARSWSLPARIAANSLVMDPMNISVAIFLSGVNKSLGGGSEARDAVVAGIDSWWKNWVATLKTSLMVWPPIHLINWMFMPQRYRVLGFNLGSLGWNTYLTWSLWLLERDVDKATQLAQVDKLTQLADTLPKKAH